MGLLDLLKRKIHVANSASIAALPAAGEAMSRAGLKFSGKAGLCYRATNHCRDAITEMTRRPGGYVITTRCNSTDDSYGCAWILFEGDLPAVASSATTSFDHLAARGCEPSFLCAAFAYEKDGKKIYWIYNRNGKFYPFAPDGEQRDNELELNLKRELEGSIPVEGILSIWYPLWGMPI